MPATLADAFATALRISPDLIIFEFAPPRKRRPLVSACRRDSAARPRAHHGHHRCDPGARPREHPGPRLLQNAFKKALAARGLNRTVRANRSGCLDQCEHKPTVVVYPDTVRYGGVAESDVEDGIESHIVGGRPVERLPLADACANTGTCPHKPRVPAVPHV